VKPGFKVWRETDPASIVQLFLAGHLATQVAQRPLSLSRDNCQVHRQCELIWNASRLPPRRVIVPDRPTETQQHVLSGRLARADVYAHQGCGVGIDNPAEPWLNCNRMTLGELAAKWKGRDLQYPAVMLVGLLEV